MRSRCGRRITTRRVSAVVALCLTISLMSWIPLVAVSHDGGVSSEEISDPGDDLTVQSTHEESEMSIGTSRNIMGDASVLDDQYDGELPRAEKYSSHLATKADVDALKAEMGVRDPNKNYNVIVDGFGTGAAPPTEEGWDSLLGNLVIVDGVSDPPQPMSIDISQSPYFPVVGNQGQQGSCTAWSVAYYANGYLQAKDKNWADASIGNPDQLMSPAWAYNKANGGQDGGSWKIDNLNVLQSVGNAVWSTMPYDQNDHTSWGSEAAWRSAPEFRIDSIESTDSSNTQVIKSWLDEDTPVLITLDADEYSDGLGTGDDTLTSVEYSHGWPNHANTIVGYDNSKGQGGEVGAFKVVNSWGSNWGSEWGGFGYFWMTYEAVAELVRPVWRFHDRVDYNPSLLAVWKLDPLGGRNANVVLGIGPYWTPDDTRNPVWDGGSYSFPLFMALDVTEFGDEWNSGIDEFFLQIGSGSGSSTITSFRIEMYEGSYSSGSPDLTSNESPDTPETTPGYVTVRFRALLTITSPDEDGYLRGITNVSGWASNMWDTKIFEEDFEHIFPGSWIVGDSNASSGEDYWGDTSYRSYGGSWSAWAADVGSKAFTDTVFEEDFEGTTPSSWVVGDSDSSEGEDYWGVSSYRSHNGSKSLWAAQVGQDSRLVYSESFDHDGSLPIGWTNYSEGPDHHPWEMVQESGSDYRAECSSDDAGPDTDITEWLYMTSGFDASSYASLTLQFYLDYNYWDGDEFARVLYSTSGSFPTFYELNTWVSDSEGTQIIDLSDAAGDSEVYLAFVYHATYDWYMRVDSVEVTGLIQNRNTHQYDDDMWAYAYRSIDLSSYDFGTLTYNYWLDSEDSYDYLYAIYYSGGSWHYEGDHTGNSSGWQIGTIAIPSSATHFGFCFTSDGSVHGYEGAYVDDIVITATYSEPNRDSRQYDDNMSAYMFRLVDLTGLDSPTISYNYWLDSEDGSDYLYLVYYDNGTWEFVDAHTGNSGGWQSSSFTIPNTSTAMGFFFESDSSAHSYEGAYLDDIALYDVDLLTGIYVRIDNGTWDLASGGVNWSYTWDTTSYSDGPHTIHVRSYFGSRYVERTRFVIVDNTPPVNPTGFSSSHSPGIWSNDNTIWIEWLGAIDTTSGVCGFSFEWTTSFLTMPDAVTDSAGASTTSPPLSDGSNWYFHVRAVDNAGNWASDAYHVGPFFLDTVVPANPDSFWSSHMPSVWSNDDTIFVSWTGASDSLSGVHGYSIYWSASSSSVPDMVEDLVAENTTGPPISDGDSWYLHIRTVDYAGNWAVDALHAGPFLVDTTPPSTTHSFIGSTGYDDWFISNVTLQLNAVDTSSGINYTEYQIDGLGWTYYFSDVLCSVDGIHTLEFRSNDTAGNLEVATSAGLKIDKVAPSNPDSSLSDHVIGAWSNYSDVFVEWFGAFDVTSGVFGYSVEWDRNPTSIPDAVVDTTLSNSTGVDLADGNDWYLHVRTRDLAGNWADGAYHVGPFWIDTSIPAPGSIVNAELEGPSWEDVNVSWDLSPSDPTDVVRYDIYYNTQYDIDGIGYALLASVPSGSTYYLHQNAGLGDQSNYFYMVRVVDISNKSLPYPEQASKFVRFLQKGWQLVSTPLIQTDQSIGSVLRTVHYDTVRYHDSNDPIDPWKECSVFKVYCDLTQITHSMGVWLNVASDSDFVVAGRIPASVDISMKKGWNLVSFPSFRDNYSVADLKAVLNAISVEGFESSDGPYHLKVLQDSELLNPGYAYWVWVPQNCVWTVSQ